jgi:NAD(P)-dependent dehydrogenase (short-subunit alcohol dehydrogenase family)
MAGKLAGKVAFITGASRGIGRNIALELAGQGASIVVAARTEDQSQSRLPGTIYTVAQEIEALGTGARVLPVRCNVADDGSVSEAVEKALSEFGGIDALINNAGVQARAPIAELEVRRWDLILRINLRGAFICTKLILPHMIQRRTGTIINISSARAERGSPGGAAYSISKRGMELMVEALAEEVREYGIKAFALAPQKAVITEGARTLGHDASLPDEQKEPPEMMGRAALYLIADAPLDLSGRRLYSLPLLAECAGG